MKQQKRYRIIVSHEVIMYGENEKAVRNSLFAHEFLKNRTNLQCIFIEEIPLHEKHEVIEDYRKAPGA